MIAPRSIEARSLLVHARMRVRLLGLVVTGALAFGCGNRGDDGGDDMPNPTARLMVVVDTPQLHWADGTAETSAVRVIIVDDFGNREDVTDEATFEIVPAQLGSVTNATITPSGDMAGLGQVLATIPDMLGMADFEVFVERTVTGTADPSTAGLFGAATLDSSGTIQLAYPPAGAMIPPNIGDMDVHWRDAAKDRYELTLTGGYVTLKTYLNTMGAATWTALADQYWKSLSSGVRGVDLTIRVRGLSSASPATYIEGSQQVRIAAEEVKGGVYYWNTTAAKIFRYDMATPSVPAEQFYPAAGQTGCVGCHAVSRDGTVVAFRQEGGNLNYGNSLSVSTLTKQLTDNTQRWNFAAIHPSNADMFTTDESGLYRTDLATQVRTPMYTAARMSHPDVSANGQLVVATQIGGTSTEVWANASRLVVFDYDTTNKTFGAPRPLVEPSGTTFPYYPSFSPDNEWVLYNQATGGNSYDNPNAEMWVTKADGTGTPIRLSEAEVVGTYNSWPKWTPFITMEPTGVATSEKVIWFTVASRRAFGVRSNFPGQTPQLWLAPFYPERAALGMPASGPAIRLPFQNLAQGNHIAQWTEQIVTIQ
jgi:mono/diheme cytochrome c family protein